jgi:hypothetical protein
MKKLPAVFRSKVRFLVLLFFVLPRLGAETPAAGTDAAGPWFSWDLLWTGSWYNSFDNSGGDFSPEDLFTGGTLANRGDLRLGLPRLDTSFRFQATDKRQLPPEEGKEGIFSPGFGLYFDGGGPAGKFLGTSRLLRGVLDEYGLPARTKNIWARSVPFPENRKPSGADLKTAPVSSRDPETYLYLGLPRWEHFSGFGTAQFDDDFNPAFGGGLEAYWGLSSFSLETFYTRKTLDPRGASGWFSSPPPLPERDFRFRALGAAFSSRNFGFASDWAFSETFAYGRDLYGSAALRFGSKPWKFSLAADAAGSRYVGRDGAAPGAGFRLAGRLERSWVRSGLFRVNTVFRSPEFGKAFNRGSLSVYFRPSAPPGKASPLFRFTRASLTLSRDARVKEKTADTLEALAGFNIGPLRTVFSGSLHSSSALESGAVPSPLPLPPCFGEFEAVKFSGELSLAAGIFQFRARTGYALKAEKDPAWDLSFGASVRPGKWGRIGLKAAAEDFPDQWSYTLSWTFEMYSR